MNHIGYIRKDNFFPGPLISVGEDRDSFFAIYPSGDRVKLTDINSLDALKSRSSFIDEPAKKIPELAYAIDKESIFSGDFISVHNSLFDYMKLNSIEIDKEVKEEITEFILTLNQQKTKEINLSKLIYISSERDRSLHITCNQRNLKRHKGIANRVLIQLVLRNAIKTIYKKNVRSENRTVDTKIPEQIINALEYKRLLQAA